MKTGTLIGVGLLLSGLVAGVAVYILQAHVYYEEVRGLEEIEIGAGRFSVSAYHGLDNDALPLRLRGCFRIADPEGALAAGDPALRPEPFAAPAWFECWDPARLDADLKAGRARAVVAARAGEGEFATERLVAIYPDGRAYQWRRLSLK